jgi:hypothetical protein
LLWRPPASRTCKRLRFAPLLASSRSPSVSSHNAR